MKNKTARKKPAVNKIYYIYVGILAVLFFIFHTIPFLRGVLYSFTDWKGYGDWNFVGLRNYLHMFTDVDTGNAYLFTFKFAVIATVLVNVISLILACALNSKIKFKNTIKAFYFLPYMLGSLIVGFIFNYIFANLIPQLGKSLGIQALSVNILGTDHAIWGIIAVAVWTGCAFNTLIYIAGLQSIDTDVYEAAALDGATGFRKFTKITFPLLAPSFTINMVLSAKGYLMVYDQIMAMTEGGPGTSTTSIAVLIYKKGFGGGQFSYQSANAVMLFIVVVYQGEELGMTNVYFDKLEDYRDIESINFFTELTESGLMTPEYMMKCLMLRSRDNARTPMQWDDSAQAGFTDGAPWIKVHPNYKEINAAQQLADPNSIFYYYQKLIRLRKEKDIIVYGGFEPLYRDNEQIFAYIRRLEQEKLLTVCNFSDKNAEMDIPEEFKGAECLITNLDRTVFESKIVLKPYEAFVLYKK